jgi:3-dehydroquinate dehydratase-1
MKQPRICAVIVSDEPEVVKESEPLAELFEVRIDLIGDGWQELVKRLSKPWIACNRRVDEGGRCGENEEKRVAALLRAVDLGADIIDIELRTENLEAAVKKIKNRAKCLLSFHELKRTPSLEEMKEIVRRQLEAGADICKVITTAQRFEDNLTVLQLVAELAEIRRVSFAMGPLGSMSRVLCPLVGADFTYASMAKGKESAPGQITVRELRNIYGMMENG